MVGHYSQTGTSARLLFLPHAPALASSGGTSQTFFVGQQISPPSVSQSSLVVHPG